MSGGGRPVIERLIPLAIAAFVVGPLAHMALHRPDHHHTPDGAVVFFEAGAGDHGHPHPHGAEHAEHGHADPDRPAHDHPSDGAPEHPHHADGGAAHLGLAPPPPTPVVTPARRVAGPPDGPPVRPPAYRPLRGYLAPTARRARAPPA